MKEQERIVWSQENKRLINKLIQSGEKITLFDWECPPRFLSIGKNGKEFINFDVDFGRIFKGQIIDKYTELPRCVVDAQKEQKYLKELQKLGVKFEYHKIIADSNAYFLAQDSVEELGQEKIEIIFENFKRYIRRATENYPAPVSVFLWTQLLKPFKAKYERYFNEALTLLRGNSGLLIPGWVYEEQAKRMKEHMGFSDYIQTTDFAERVVATYAAEGMVFALLSRTEKFKNCAWLNIREIDKRTAIITNCLRLKYDLQELPAIICA